MISVKVSDNRRNVEVKVSLRNKLGQWRRNRENPEIRNGFSFRNLYSDYSCRNQEDRLLCCCLERGEMSLDFQWNRCFCDC